MLGPFTFTLESEEFEKSEKVGAADLYQPMITTRAPDGANKDLLLDLKDELKVLIDKLKVD